MQDRRTPRETQLPFCSWALLLLGLCAAAQDPLDLARLHDFRAFRSSSNNPDPTSNDDSLRPIPGETVVLADLQGPGVVTHIWLTIAARVLRRQRHAQRGCAGRRFLRRRPRSRNSYWPMPFRRACKITIANEGRVRLSNLYYYVDWQKRKDLPKDIGYFHAWYRQEIPAQAGHPYQVLSVQGRGQYVGTVLNVIQTQPGWFGEGDDMEERPDIFSSVAFWYQDGIAQGLPEPPYGAARLPHGNARQIDTAPLLPLAKTEGGTAEVQRQVFWGRDLLFFRATGSGSRIELPLNVPAAAFYEIVAQAAHAPDSCPPAAHLGTGTVRGRGSPAGLEAIDPRTPHPRLHLHRQRRALRGL